MTRPQLRRQPLRPQLAAVLESVSVAPVALPASSAVPQGGAAARAPSRGARVPARVRGMLNNTIFLIFCLLHNLPFMERKNCGGLYLVFRLYVERSFN